MIGEPAKAVLKVEASRLLMQCIDYDQFEADVVRGPFEPGEGVEEEQSADPRALVVAVDCEACQEYRWDRVARDAAERLTRILGRQFVGNRRVVARDPCQGP